MKKKGNVINLIAILVLSILSTISVYGIVNLTDKVHTLEESLKDEINKDLILPDTVELLSFYVDTPTEQSVYEALVYFQVPCHKVVLSQSKLETGNYRYNNNNNLFGLMSRDGTYMRFNHWIESVISYKKYISTKYTGNNEDEDYLKFLQRLGYAEAPDYCNILRVMLKDVSHLD